MRIRFSFGRIGVRSLWQASLGFGMVIALFGMYLLVSGYRSAPETLRVDSAVLGDVRSIGKVLGEATTEDPGWEGGESTVTNIFAIDTGTADIREALEKSSDHLLQRKWVITAQRLPETILLEAIDHRGTSLQIDAFHPLKMGEYPEPIKKAVGMSTNPEELLIVYAFVGWSVLHDGDPVSG